jgi:alpha-L-fucosidase
MNKKIMILLAICLFVTSCNPVKKNTQPDMESDWLKMNAMKQENLEWFTGAKFGMFIHWGLYSIPAGIWKGKKMEEMGRPYVAEWIQCVAEIPRDEYALLAKEFNPIMFDAESIARLARDAG